MRRAAVFRLCLEKDGLRLSGTVKTEILLVLLPAVGTIRKLLYSFLCYYRLGERRAPSLLCGSEAAVGAVALGCIRS